MKKGFTLIEIIIYIGIVAAVLLAAFNFGWEIIFGNVKSQAIREVQQNARFAMEKITKTIEESSAINIPFNPGETASTLSLKMSDQNLDPTVFDVFDNKLRITRGSIGPYELTNDRVVVGSLQFTNLSYPDTPGTIRIEMTTNHINPAGRQEYNVSFKTESTASLAPEGAAPPYLVLLHYRWRNDDGGE